MNTNDLFKNPIVLFLAGILALYLVLFLLKVVVNIFWIVMLAFIILFVINDRFRNTIRAFFTNLFGS